MYLDQKQKIYTCMDSKNYVPLLKTKDIHLHGINGDYIKKKLWYMISYKLNQIRCTKQKHYSARAQKNDERVIIIVANRWLLIIIVLLVLTI